MNVGSRIKLPWLHLGFPQISQVVLNKYFFFTPAFFPRALIMYMQISQNPILRSEAYLVPRRMPYPMYIAYYIYTYTKVITYSAPHCFYYHIIFFLIFPPFPSKPPPRTSLWPQYTRFFLKLYQTEITGSFPDPAIRLIFGLKPGPYNYVIGFVPILSHLPTVSYLWDHQRSPHKHKPMRPSWRTKTHLPLGKCCESRSVTGIWAKDQNFLIITIYIHTRTWTTYFNFKYLNNIILCILFKRDTKKLVSNTDNKVWFCG